MSLSHPRKLSVANVADIRRRFQEGWTRDMLHREYNFVTRGTLNQVIVGRTHRHVLPRQRLVGVDLDGICFNFLGAFCKWLEDKAGVKMPEDEEITSYYWYETVDGLDKDTFWDEFHKFGYAQGYRNLNLLPGTLEALDALVNAGHELIYITNRPSYARECTIAALATHNFPFRDRLIFARGSKAPVIREYNVDAFIDDSPRTIAEICVNTDARIYCRDYPFNRSIHDIHNFIRVRSWSEFLAEEGIGANV